MADAFRSLSIEINQMIGAELENDTDIAKYRLICVSTKDAIDGDDDSFWRKRFLQHFDLPMATVSTKRHLDSGTLKQMYQQRRQALRQGANFRLGSDPKNKSKCLKVMRDLIVDSFGGAKSDEDGVSESKNMQVIRQFIYNHGLLDDVLRPAPNKSAQLESRHVREDPLLIIIQLVLTHFSLTAEPSTAVAKPWRFPTSQQMVYAPSTERPIFKGPSGLEVDVEWCLHVANFFKTHFLSQAEVLFQPYNKLAPNERPHGWAKPLYSEPPKLGRMWKGAYAYVAHDEIDKIRRGDNEETAIQDQVNAKETAGDGFQSLCLSAGDAGMPWPPTFERVLKSLTKPIIRAKTRAQKRALGGCGGTSPIGEPVAFRFQGQGEDNAEPFLASGWMNPLPPQHGVPGWMRMTMMKYFVDEHGAIDMDSLWAYEGVVLPGGMIAVGRWWHPIPGEPADEYTGPFILWNVDGSETEEPGL
ncbi:hypothetical protein MBLNU459_g1427t1 [Dothideomycetes sp. NU459]